MSRKRTIVIDGELCDVLENTHKTDGRTWSDVVAVLLGYDDLKDFHKSNNIVTRNKNRCDKTLDMFDNE